VGMVQGGRNIKMEAAYVRKLSELRGVLFTGSERSTPIRSW
jgi:hypothetical protein